MPSAQHQNVPFSVELKALTAAGAVDTTFSRVSTLSGLDIRAPSIGIGTTSPSWSAGTASGVSLYINATLPNETLVTGGGATGLDTVSSSPFPLL